MLNLKPTWDEPLDDRETATAALHVAFPGFAPPFDRQAAWLYARLLRATTQTMAIGAVRREVRAGFPRSADPDRAVRRLLENPLSHAYVTWQRRSDGVRVFVGETPCALSLPVGQDPRLPGFDLNDWMFSAARESPCPRED